MKGNIEYEWTHRMFSIDCHFKLDSKYVDELHTLNMIIFTIMTEHREY